MNHFQSLAHGACRCLVAVNHFHSAGLIAAIFLPAIQISAQPSKPLPVPRVQSIPLPNEETSFQRDGVELTRYYFGTNLHRPFLYPIAGPSGRSLTRMGHPHDPITHSHHNSVWISHHDINGISFWDDRGQGRIIQRSIAEFQDGEEAASVLVVNEWRSASGAVLLEERRRTTVQLLPKDEWMLVLDLRFEAKVNDVVFGKTPFGVIGVRMAKTIGVSDGGGTIRNSSGAMNEKEVLWKAARWIDYSGPITSKSIEGITLFDHPINPNHPSVMHVRNDGWMGASLTFDGPRSLAKGETLDLRYALYVHHGMPSSNVLHHRWLSFADKRPEPFPAKRK